MANWLFSRGLQIMLFMVSFYVLGYCFYYGIKDLLDEYRAKRFPTEGETGSR